MSEVGIFTFNARVFYRICKLFRDEHFSFIALDSFESLPHGICVLVTTLEDLETFDPSLPESLTVLIVLPHMTDLEIMIRSNQYSKSKFYFKSITIAIDPGTESTGIAIFFDDVFIYSREIYSLPQLNELITTVLEICPNYPMTIKLGTGYSELSDHFLIQLASQQKTAKKIQFVLVNEKYTSSKEHEGHYKPTTLRRKSVHEKAAILIGRRQGELIQLDIDVNEKT